MKNKILIPTVLFVLVSVSSFVILSQGKNQKQIRSDNFVNGETRPQWENQIIFFYGEGCPHCAIVDKYIKENKVAEKVAFSQKEVYYNSNNSKELEEKARICGMPTDSIGVPFLWDGEKCLVGDADIVNFFKQKINTQ